MSKKKDEVNHEMNRKTFPIVAIGASAGGLEAFQEFFQSMPSDSGMAFVIVIHLDPNHVSMLPDILQKHTKMTVHQVKDGMAVEPNHIYIIAPNKDLSICNNVLSLHEFSSPSVRMPIDFFFQSLATDQGSKSICIIFSGTGSDGTLGLRGIKGELGMTMVQTLESAKYDGMPRNAIATKLVDYVLPPKEMPQTIIQYTEHKIVTNKNQSSHASEISSDFLFKITNILRSKTSHDFSSYKNNTLFRRIERRMNVHQILEVHEYLRFLQESDHEAHLLFKDLLIGVTNFFRDPDAFNSLQEKIMQILSEKKQEDTIRVWIPGCSSGEEAYSIAILLHECIKKSQKHVTVQIYGTDLDEDSIHTARQGKYPASIARDISKDRIKQFFFCEESQYEIKKQIRETLVFAPHNIISDPPFTKLDLICCRNLLIYLNTDLQNQLISMFHYCLTFHGILFLGPSETVGKHGDIFTLTDKKWKIYRRNALTDTSPVVLNLSSSQHTKTQKYQDISEPVKGVKDNNLNQFAQLILHQSQTPPCVILDEGLNVMYIHGNLSKFIELPEGRISINILNMAKLELKAILNSAINKVRQYKQEVIQHDVQCMHNGQMIHVTITVKPILNQVEMYGLIMVIFQENLSDDQEDIKQSTLTEKAISFASQEELRYELKYTRDNLQATIEQLEVSNEELKSANEELQSTNEEMQSTNEELETSKEELQSLNEESITVNSELQNRLDQLALANDDLKNLLDNTDAATIFLDYEYCIRRYTSKTEAIISLKAEDIGRPIHHFALHLEGDIDLLSYAKKVLDHMNLIETEVRSIHGVDYMMYLRPYRTINNVIDGVVIVFQDISTIKILENERKEDKRRVQRVCESIVSTVRESFLVLDQNLKIEFANRAFYSFFQTSKENTIGQKIYDLGNGQWDIQELRELLEKVIPEKSVIENYQMSHEFERIGYREILLNARLLNMKESEIQYIFIGIHDITKISTSM